MPRCYNESQASADNNLFHKLHYIILGRDSEKWEIVVVVVVAPNHREKSFCRCSFFFITIPFTDANLLRTA